MFLRLIGFMVLFYFVFASVGEAKTPVSPRPSSRTAEIKQKVTRATSRKRPEATASRKRSQRVSRIGNQSRVVNARTRPTRVASVRTRQLRTVRARTRQSQIATARSRQSRGTAVRTEQPRAIAARRTHVSKIRPMRQTARHPIQAPIPISPPPTYLSQLKPHMQRNAQLGGLDKLYSKNLLGQAQTIAVVENSGTWTEMKNVLNKTVGNLPDETRERYKQNFLLPVGKPGLDPNAINPQLNKNVYHGSSVSSVVLDLSPHAKVLPISTIYNPQPDQSYDTADALMDLLKNKDVNIINFSAGYKSFTCNSEMKHDADGTLKRMFKVAYKPKLAEAFKSAARAEKVMVIAVGNKGENILPLEFRVKLKAKTKEFVAHLIETLDPETRKSIVLAGNFDPDIHVANIKSNRPGNWLEVQERFLFAPGKSEISYFPGLVGDGTSNSAPYICAAIANLCSKPGVTPKKAVQALLETADQRPEKHVYGRGIIRADKALELLERGM